MKTILIAAGVTAALNTSIIWVNTFASSWATASEPVGLAVWGITLFVVGGSLKKVYAPQREGAAATSGRRGTEPGPGAIVVAELKVGVSAFSHR